MEWKCDRANEKLEEDHEEGRKFKKVSQLNSIKDGKTTTMQEIGNKDKYNGN